MVVVFGVGFLLGRVFDDFGCGTCCGGFWIKNLC